MYPLGEAQPYALAMQDEMIREVEGGRPEYVEFVHVPESWPLQLEQVSRLLDWWQQYRADHYSLVGAVDITSKERTEYRWDAAAEGYRMQGGDYLQVYRRR